MKVPATSRIDDSGRRVERPPDLTRYSATGGVVRAEHLGRQRRQHRRAGRNLGHFGPGPVPRRNLGDDRPEPDGNGMTLRLPLILRREVHLEVRDFRTLAQEVVANQAVEIERRRRAGIDLNVPDVGVGQEPFRDFMGRAGTHFERGAFG